MISEYVHEWLNWIIGVENPIGNWCIVPPLLALLLIKMWLDRNKNG